MQIAAWYVLLLLPPILWIAWSTRRRSTPAVAVPDGSAFLTAHRTLRVRVLPWLTVVQLLAVVLLVAGLARPRVGKADSVLAADGIDLVLAVDISSSMARNYIETETRLEATKVVIKEFIDSREEDRIGIVVFQLDALVYSPLTLDHDALRKMVEELQSGLIGDGTSIGDGLAASLTLLLDSTAASRAVILLTDGNDNGKSISPMDAAQLAVPLRIPVYTIGVVGSEENSIFNEVDIELLQDISRLTDAKFFSATTKEDLAAVYDEISSLETSKVEGETYERWVEVGPWLLLVGASLLATVIALRGTWLRGSA